MHSLTSQFVSGFVCIGYLLFGRNHLVIFILVSVRYVFLVSIFYSILRIYIFVAFCCVQSVAFCGFLVPFWQIFQHFYPMQLSVFPPFFVSFLPSFRCRLTLFFYPFCRVSLQPLSSFCGFILVKVVFIFLNFSLNLCLF